MKTKDDSPLLPVSRLSKLEGFDFLSNQNQALLLQKGLTTTLNKNSTLFYQGDRVDHFYVIISGAIKMIKAMETSEKDDETLIDILGPGELVGGSLLLQENECKFPASARAMGKTEVLCFERAFFNTSWKSSPELMEYVHRQIMRRIQRMQADRCIQRYSLEQKLAYFLTEKVAPIKGLKITRKDMADCIGSSSEAVIRQLAKWNVDQLVSTFNHEITICDHERLKKIWMDSV